MKSTNYRRGRYRGKRKTKREKKFNQKVTKIAKKAIYNIAEKKQFADSGALSFTTAFTYITTAISTTVGTRWLFNVPNGNRTVTGGIVDSTPGKQGAGGFQRIGNQIDVHEIEWNGTLRMTGNGSQDVRVMMFIESNPEGVSFGTNELLYDFGSGLSTYSPYSYSEAIASKRFRILYDRIHTIATGPGAAGTVQDYKNVHIKRRFKKPVRVIYYDDTGSLSVVGIEKNAIYVVLFAGGGNATLSQAYGNMIYSDI